MENKFRINFQLKHSAFQELHLKDEGRVCRDDGRVSSAAVRVVRRAGQLSQLAKAHLWRQWSYRKLWNRFNTYILHWQSCSNEIKFPHSHQCGFMTFWVKQYPLALLSMSKQSKHKLRWPHQRILFLEASRATEDIIQLFSEYISSPYQNNSHGFICTDDSQPRGAW